MTQDLLILGSFQIKFFFIYCPLIVITCTKVNQIELVFFSLQGNMWESLE
jgi:hypothetical protein